MLFLNKIKKIFALLPLAVVGVALGFAGLSTGYRILGIPYLPNFFKFLATLSFLIYVFRYILLPKEFIRDLHHPIRGCLLPTFGMLTMLISTYIIPYNINMAILLWIFGLSFHFVIYLLYFWIQRKNLKFQRLLPIYLIPTASHVLAVFTGVSFQMATLTRLVFWVGIVSYFVLLPFLIYRIIFHKKRIPCEKKPFIAVLGAPCSVCLSSYIVNFEDHNLILVYTLYTLVLIFLTVNIKLFFTLVRNHFSYNFGAFTFPFSAAAIATLEIWILHGSPYNKFYFFTFLVLFLATFIILLIAVKVYTLIYKSIKKIKGLSI